MMSANYWWRASNWLNFSMSSDPIQPQSNLIEALQSRVLASRALIRTFELARWHLFSPKELWIIQKGLRSVVLEETTGGSIETLAQSQNLLESLHAHINERYLLPSKGTKPEGSGPIP
jgi:hypothetical protein